MMIYRVNYGTSPHNCTTGHYLFQNPERYSPFEFEKIVSEVFLKCTEKYYGVDLQNSRFIVDFGFVNEMEERGFEYIKEDLEVDVCDSMTYEELNASVKRNSGHVAKRLVDDDWSEEEIIEHCFDFKGKTAKEISKEESEPFSPCDNGLMSMDDFKALIEKVYFEFEDTELSSVEDRTINFGGREALEKLAKEIGFEIKRGFPQYYNWEEGEDHG